LTNKELFEFCEFQPGIESTWTLQHERAIDVVFNTIDDLLLAGEFDSVNQMLQDLIEFGVERLSDTLIVAFLTITLAAKSKLPARQPLFDKIEKHFEKTHSNEDVFKLLQGLGVGKYDIDYRR